MDVSTIALGGLDQAQSLLDSTANQIANLGSKSDTVDLSQAAVSLLQTRADFEANLATVKVSDQMTQSLFDVLG
jgi:flagellar hook protein FlgE